MEISREAFQALKNVPFFKGKIQTDSMEPLIKVGDTVVVEVGNLELKRFDIIVFYDDQKLICHYLWHKNVVVTPVMLQTRNLHGKKDCPIKLENYLGKVVSHHLSTYQKFRSLF